jgi:hypothetical protein
MKTKPCSRRRGGSTTSSSRFPYLTGAELLVMHGSEQTCYARDSAVYSGAGGLCAFDPNDCAGSVQSYCGGYNGADAYRYHAYLCV